MGVAAVVSLAVGLIASGPALAQGGGGGGGGRGGGGGGLFGGFGGGMGQLFDGPVNTKELESYASLLGLDATQKQAAQALHDAATAEFAAKAKAMRDKMDAARNEARDSGDPSVFRAIQNQMADFMKTREATEKSFLDDYKALLTPGQLEKWPAVERLRRREHTVGRGLLSGERVDLVKIVDDLKLPADARQPLTPTLDQYEVDLDRELAKRNEIYDLAQAKIREMMAGGGDFRQMMSADNPEINDLFKKGREAATRVRDVNRKYARQIESALPDAQRSQFDASVQRESFPRIYRPSHATRVVDAAAAMPELDSNQKAAISAIKETFTRDLGAINKDMEAAQEEQEMTVTPQQMFRMGGDAGKMGELRNKQRDLENDTVKRVQELLTPAQRDRLPKRDQAPDGNGNGPRQRGQPGQGGPGGNGQPPTTRID